MGNTQQQQVQYSLPIAGSKEDGFTEIYRNPNYMGGLLTGLPNFETIGDIWKHNFENFPDTPTLGWRHKSGVTR